MVTIGAFAVLGAYFQLEKFSYEKTKTIRSYNNKVISNERMVWAMERREIFYDMLSLTMLIAEDFSRWSKWQDIYTLFQHHIP